MSINFWVLSSTPSPSSLPFFLTHSPSPPFPSVSMCFTLAKFVIYYHLFPSTLWDLQHHQFLRTILLRERDQALYPEEKTNHHTRYQHTDEGHLLLLTPLAVLFHMLLAPRPTLLSLHPSACTSISLRTKVQSALGKFHAPLSVTVICLYWHVDFCNAHCTVSICKGISSGNKGHIS